MKIYTNGKIITKVKQNINYLICQKLVYNLVILWYNRLK